MQTATPPAPGPQRQAVGAGTATGVAVFTLADRPAREDVPLVVVDRHTWPERVTLYPRVAARVTSRCREAVRYTIARGRDPVVLAEVARPPGRTFGDFHVPCFPLENPAS